MVEEDLLPPAILVVAALALLAFLALVWVVGPVAAQAAAVELLRVYLSVVTTFTGHFPVLASQRKPGVVVVVERDLFPAVVAMAAFALAAVTTLVVVVVLVAAVAGRRELAPR